MKNMPGVQKAEYERLAKLRAGITLSRFQELLEEDHAEFQTSASGGLERHVYVRPYDYVLAVTDTNQAVVSFSVLVRKEGFHPTFGDVILGKSALASALDTPGSIIGDCGRPPLYFEFTSQSNAFPQVRAFGITMSGYADKKDIDLVCKANDQLFRCGGYEPVDVKCFLRSAEGKLLRDRVRPNIYVEGAADPKISVELLISAELLAPDETEITVPEG